MDLISLIIMLAAVGLILWLVTTYIPMDDTIKRVITAVVVIVVVLYVLSLFVAIPNIRVGR